MSSSDVQSEGTEPGSGRPRGWVRRAWAVPASLPGAAANGPVPLGPRARLLADELTGLGAAAWGGRRGGRCRRSGSGRQPGRRSLHAPVSRFPEPEVQSLHDSSCPGPSENGSVSPSPRPQVCRVPGGGGAGCHGVRPTAGLPRARGADATELTPFAQYCFDLYFFTEQKERLCPEKTRAEPVRCPVALRP